MATSINNNLTAQLALQVLNTTMGSLQKTQAEISTGLRVAGPSDDSAVYSEAQRLRADTDSLQSVTNSLNRASSIINVASTAGVSISDLLNQIKTKVVAGADPSNDTISRKAYNQDVQALLAQITRTVQSASFSGANLLDGSIPSAGLSFIADAGATNFITVFTQNLNLGHGIVTLSATANILTASSASRMLTSVNQSIANVNASLATIGAAGTAISQRVAFISNLSVSLNSGISNLVDADVASESAKLQALQVKQQLGVQMLSIANTQSQVLLSLFK